MSLRKVLAALFFFWHAAAVLVSNLPPISLYPPHALDASGFTSLQDIEKTLMAVRHYSVLKPLITYANFTGTDQMWTTFAPVPPKDATWLSVVAADKAGKETLVWTSLPADPYGVNRRYRQRVKFLEDLPQQGFGALQFLFVKSFVEPYRALKGEPADTIGLVLHTLEVPRPHVAANLRSTQLKHQVLFSMRPADNPVLAPKL
jgi:hypothetical protein